MIRIERTVSVPKPAHRVAAYMHDFCTTNEWDPGTVITERLSGDGGVGSVYRNVSKVAGRKNELMYTVEEFEPGRVLDLRGENKSVETHDRISVAAKGDGAEVTYLAEFHPKGYLKLFEPLMRPFLERLGDNAARGMREQLLEL